ncbi:MAG: carboxypeptidase-like regulatory domain-containing protein [Candidatus Bathyarchaeia archaeon]
MKRRSLPVQFALLALLALMASPTSIPAIAAPEPDPPGDWVALNPGSSCGRLGDPLGKVVKSYADSAVFAGCAGDLEFTVHFDVPRDGVRIYVPDSFSGWTELLPSGNWSTANVWTSLTEDYRFLTVDRAGPRDPVAPGWWRITVWNRTAQGYPAGDHVVRIFNVRAPWVLGRYHFKVYVLPNPSGPRPIQEGLFRSIGWERFPTLVVKGAVNPAHISGTLRVAGLSEGHGAPVGVSGKVLAIRMGPGGWNFSAQAFSRDGEYLLCGLPAGTWRLIASASGFLQSERIVEVAEGQSLDGIDIGLQPAPTISGIVRSKWIGPGGSALVSWGMVKYGIDASWSNRTINIELLSPSGEIISGSKYPFPELDPNSSEYRFLIKGASLTGHVPSDEADYVAGIEPGEYRLRAFVNGYIQTRDFPVAVSHPGEVFTEMDLYRGPRISVRVLFQSQPSLLKASPVEYDRTLLVEAFGADGALRAWNLTIVPAGAEEAEIELTGLWSAPWPRSLYYWAGLRDYGLEPGIYAIKAWSVGYYHPALDRISVLSGPSPSKISLKVYKGGSISVTASSNRAQAPLIQIPWAYPGRAIRFDFYLDGEWAGWASAEQTVGSQSATVRFEGNFAWGRDGSDLAYFKGERDSGLRAGVCTVLVSTLGYHQPKAASAQVGIGSASDISIPLVISPRLGLAIHFRREGLVSPIDGDYPIRVEVFSAGRLVGANFGIVPAGSTSHWIEIRGLEGYAGASGANRWVNYWVTTDGQLVRDGGLPPSLPLEVVVYVPSYQLGLLRTPGSSWDFFLETSLEKLGRIWGSMSCFDRWGVLKPLAWGLVEASGPAEVKAPSMDGGTFSIWLPPGSYSIQFSAPPHLQTIPPQTLQLIVSPAADSPLGIELASTGAPIPEFASRGVSSMLVLLPFALAFANFARRFNSKRS